MLNPGDIVRIIFPVGSEEDPNSMSLVMGDVALILMIEEIEPKTFLWDPPPQLYSFRGDIFIHGKIQRGSVCAFKISEQPQKYF